MGKLVYSDDVKELLLGLDSLPWEEQVDEIVNSLPTVDAVPVRRGKWKYHQKKRVLRYVQCVALRENWTMILEVL